jgi:hypothetical protein
VTTRPEHITPELFQKWRPPVRGTLNPQVMTNPVWTWLIESRLNAYQANELFGGESALQAGPGWCFERFGQSSTLLPDGRTVLIAGEHEDHYDPDFFIYNDVVVRSAGGEVEILGYPTDVFPPTDFHSATLLDRQIVIIGSLGYQGERHAGITQVMTLELDRWQISPVHTKGTGPGWIHRHQAQLSDDGRHILISGGKIDRCDGEELVENIDEWRLSIGDWQWTRLTSRHWPRFSVFRQDRRAMHLWQMRQAVWSKSVRWDDDAAEWERKLNEALGSPPRLDLVPELYRPPIAHEALPANSEEYGVYRIRIGGVIVRYVESTFSLQVTVQGDLPTDAVEAIRSDLSEKLEALEKTPIALRDVAAA